MNASFFFVLGAMFLIIYMLMIRPQRQQQRRHAEMLNALKVGDEVITAGGIYGDVVAVEEDRVVLEIAEDVEIEVAKRAIASVVPAQAYEEEADGDDLDAAAAEQAEEVPQEDAARR